jgi:hypothetical protein
MVLAAVTATAWILGAGVDGYPLAVEPLFPALLVGVACLAADRLLSLANKS